MIAGAKPGYLAEVRDCGSGDVRANAHLIAAAPDLYAALEWAAQNAEESEAGRDSEWYANLERCNAALAKARGQA